MARVGLAWLVLLASAASAFDRTCKDAYNINDYGAVPGIDTAAQATANGAAFQRALSLANNSFNRAVLIPGGGSYSYLPAASEFSDFAYITICVEGTLRLYTANFTTTYPGWPEPWDMFRFTNVRGLAFASETGAGLIDGRGSEWWWYKILKGGQRPQLLYVDHGFGIEVSGVTFKNAPNYHAYLSDQFALFVKGVTVIVDLDEQVEALAYAHGLETGSSTRHQLLSAMGPSKRQANLLTRGKVPLPPRVLDFSWADPAWAINPPFPMVYALNTDGIDVSGADITVTNCTITNFDDTVCVKPMAPSRSTNNIACTNDVRISNISVTYGVGVSMGSVPPDVGGNCIANVQVDNVDFHTPLKAVYVKPNPAKVGENATGTLVNVTYSNLRIDQPLWWAVWIGTQQMNEDGHSTGCSFLYPLPNTSCPSDPQVTVKNIVLQNVSVTRPLLSPGVIMGNVSNPVTGLVFDNVVVHNASRWPVEGGYLCKEGVSGVATGGTYPVPPCFNISADGTTP